ncbi:MAG TPA: DUF732 domain-containing protein [Mycobacterium sp.]|jgi:hypothetical protein
MTTNLRILGTAGLAIAAAAVAFAPDAAATPASFFDELHTNNVWLPNKTPDQVLAAGYATCSDLKGGASVLDEMSAVEQKYNFNQGTLFVSASTTNLCPDFAG